MSVIGYILLFLGGFWCLGRIQNQGVMYRMFLRNMNTKGVLEAVSTYFKIEILLGYGMGVGLISLGCYLIWGYFPLKLALGLFSALFYVLACYVSYINITEIGYRRQTEITPFEFKNPTIVSTIPLGHPVFLIIIYFILGSLSYHL